MRPRLYTIMMLDGPHIWLQAFLAASSKKENQSGIQITNPKIKHSRRSETS